jgi:deoxyhypusine synthase
VKEDAEHVTIYADATLVLPFMLSALISRLK